MNTQSNHSNTGRYSRVLFATVLLIGLALNTGLPFGLSLSSANASINAQAQRSDSTGADVGTLHGQVIGNGNAEARPTVVEQAPSATLIPTYTPQPPATKAPTATTIVPTPTDSSVVYYCHSTGAETGPYTPMSSPPDMVTTGHMGHTGGVYPTSGWGDIIPPFTKNGHTYSMNWNAAGQAIWNNSCQPVTRAVMITNTPATSSNNCTYTPDFWMNHPSSWPVMAITIGGLSYTQAQLINILKVPSNGDISLTLMKQVIAAVLSVSRGSDATVVQATIQAVNDWLWTNPPNSGVTGTAADKGTAYASTLDNYINGVTGPGHCTDDTSISPALQPALQPLGPGSRPTSPPANWGPQTNATSMPSRPTSAPANWRPQTNATTVPNTSPELQPNLKATGMATYTPDSKKIMLCHSTNSGTNYYDVVDVSIDSVENAKTVHGHGADDGAIWSDGAKQWGDIIPPFDYGDIHFPGLNWTAEGTSVWSAGCSVAPLIKSKETPTPSQTPAPTATNTPAPLVTSTPDQTYNVTCQKGPADADNGTTCNEYYSAKFEHHDGAWWKVSTTCMSTVECEAVPTATPQGTKSSNELPCTPKTTEDGFILDCSSTNDSPIQTWNIHADLDTTCPVNQVVRSPYPRAMVNMTNTLNLQPASGIVNLVRTGLISPDNLSAFVDADGNPTKDGYTQNIWKNLQLSMQSRRFEGGETWFGQTVPKAQWSFTDRSWNVNGPFAQQQEGPQATYVYQTSSAGMETTNGRAFDMANKVPANTYNLPAYGVSIKSFCAHEWTATYEIAARIWQPSGPCYQTMLYPDGTTEEPDGTSNEGCQPGWVSPGAWQYGWVTKTTPWTGINMQQVGEPNTYDIVTAAKAGGNFNGQMYWDDTNGIWVPVVEIQSVLREECVATGKCAPPKAGDN